MGYILPNDFKSICEELDRAIPNIFIETGTYKGGIAHRCLDSKIGLTDFETWHTIEIGLDLCQIASKRYKYFEEYYPNMPPKEKIHTEEKDVEFKSGSIGTYFNDQLFLYHGSSLDILPKILSTIHEPCCFWLDAHAGSEKYSGDPNNVPLLTEIEIIGTHEIRNHIIAIDDAHLFGTNQGGACDYRHITKKIIADKIRKINPRYQVAVFDPYGMEMLIAYV